MYVWWYVSIKICHTIKIDARHELEKHNRVGVLAKYVLTNLHPVNYGSAKKHVFPPPQKWEKDWFQKIYQEVY